MLSTVWVTLPSVTTEEKLRKIVADNGNSMYAAPGSFSDKIDRNMLDDCELGAIVALYGHGERPSEVATYMNVRGLFGRPLLLRVQEKLVHYNDRLSAAKNEREFVRAFPRFQWEVLTREMRETHFYLYRNMNLRKAKNHVGVWANRNGAYPEETITGTIFLK